jgi:hypothetical protein
MGPVNQIISPFDSIASVAVVGDGNPALHDPAGIGGFSLDGDFDRQNRCVGGW